MCSTLLDLARKEIKGKIYKHNKTPSWRAERKRQPATLQVGVRGADTDGTGTYQENDCERSCTRACCQV
jgi:hypothetical protein